MKRCLGALALTASLFCGAVASAATVTVDDPTTVFADFEFNASSVDEADATGSGVVLTGPGTPTSTIAVGVADFGASMAGDNGLAVLFSKAANLPSVRFVVSVEQDSFSANGNGPFLRNFQLRIEDAATGGMVFFDGPITGADGIPLVGADADTLLAFDTLAGVDTIRLTFFGEHFGNGFPDINIAVSSVPVPAALPLLLSGIAGLGFAARRRSGNLRAAG